MNLEEKYEDIIEVYTKIVDKNDEFEDETYIYRKNKFKNDCEYKHKDNRKFNKKHNNKRWS